ncbi:leucine-rich melanocyte differentiation-associated protein isoform X2 [Harpegnathos saltator]|uniref:Leucine-rich repeat-containing protein C10orf11-like protein n=3 Tax=Harpegnathos saltator TaxID=610380 RepID=E2BCE1_HARSA|nr:leucine-rich melanocyte differentiation-associated protein isoform X2 [Harpegnathos saltator]EFN86677.1 Leucine-rich repeat-containing protein C10orf11-like protein [Harpegnathos saltator]
MTSLGKLVFGDIHQRYIKDSSRRSLTQDDLSAEYTDSLSLAYENLLYMPMDIIETYGVTIDTLDISYNKFSRNLQFLLEFDHLTSLNLDHNIIDEHTVFPYMPQLELLWLNHNGINTLYPFIKNLCKSLPNLRYLCLMGNNAAPSYLNDGTSYDHLQYRLFVISWFPMLVHLDDSKVTADQRREARKLFKRPLFEDLLQHTIVPECVKHLHNRITNTLWGFDKRRKNLIV